MSGADYSRYSSTLAAEAGNGGVYSGIGRAGQYDKYSDKQLSGRPAGDARGSIGLYESAAAALEPARRDHLPGADVARISRIEDGYSRPQETAR